MAKNVLLAFVLVTIGFAAGKEVAARRQKDIVPPERPAPAAAGDKVIVYYLHTTFRCAACNEIERLTKALVETEFAAEVAAGRIEWREANFQLDEGLAKRYEVVSSCVVVVGAQGGRETGFQRLDEVWTRYKDPSGFNNYVGDAIRKRLGGGKP